MTYFPHFTGHDINITLFFGGIHFIYKIFRWHIKMDFFLCGEKNNIKIFNFKKKKEQTNICIWEKKEKIFSISKFDEGNIKWINIIISSLNQEIQV